MNDIFGNTVHHPERIHYYKVSGQELEPCNTRRPVAFRNELAHKLNSPTLRVAFYDVTGIYLGAVWTQFSHRYRMRLWPRST